MAKGFAQTRYTARRQFNGYYRLGLAMLCFATTLLAGCTLPGYSSNPVRGDSWYNFGSKGDTTFQDKLNKEPVEYDARVVKITPALIKYQKSEAAKQKLPAAEKALTAPSGNHPYRIGVGDVLRVIVYGQDDLNNPGGSSNSGDADGQVVNSNGNIYYPYAGEIKVSGKTPTQVRRELTSKLSSVIRDPQVDVRVMKYQSQRVYISGDISKPCAVSLTNVTNTVLQALDQCDTLTSGKSASSAAPAAGVQNVVLIRNGKSTFLDLNQIYAAGNPVPLKAGDRLLVDDSANRVFMMGEFDKQQALPYSTGGMSLSDAISDAGGLDLNTANPKRIYVVRGFISDQSVVAGHLKTVMRPNVYELNMSHVGGMLLANEFQLKPRDIVFAAPASLVNFNRALSQITPSLNVILQSLLLYQRAGSGNGGL
ncbi:polysaccharide biosynthesis/export family protein [Salinisphaera hydrothermalis]|uniref:polysaccharide biosynthesis/export family protein n=1 Tax=Salinisphaera hydrothermalis TaxID=563188 RepID=UPI00333FE36F